MADGAGKRADGGEKRGRRTGTIPGEEKIPPETAPDRRPFDLSQQLLHHVLIDLLAFLFPVVAHRLGGSLVGDGDGQLDGIGVFFLHHAVDRKFVGRVAVVVRHDGHLVPQLHLIVRHVLVDLRPDGGGDAVLKIAQGLLAGFREGVIGGVPDGLGADHAGLGELGEDGLEGEVSGVAPVQDKFGDLSVGQGKVHLLKHIEDDELVQREWFGHGFSPLCWCLGLFAARCGMLVG